MQNHPVLKPPQKEMQNQNKQTNINQETILGEQNQSGK